MRIALSIFLVLIVSLLQAQSTYFPLNSQAYGIIDRWDVKSGENYFTSIKPISRKYLAGKMGSVASLNHTADRFDKQYITLETADFQDSIPSRPNPVFGKFFKRASDFFIVDNSTFQLHVNPVMAFTYGKDFQGRNDEILFENYRGLEIYGTIDRKVGFYTLLTENQARYPEYVQAIASMDSALAVPYEGFWKQYGGTGVDFLRAQSYIDVNISKHLTAQLGYGKHFIGDGRRSMILSDVGNNYPYLRFTSRIWKIEYSNIFAQLIAQTKGGAYGLDGIAPFPKKQFANHHLSIRFNDKFTLGLFESVINGDTTGVKSWGIFVPLIFYKAMEQQDGSAGNTILGANFKTNLWNRISLYGQLVIDELVVSEIKNNRGWWGNKQGFQLGIKYFDMLGIPQLNGQLELNKARPYLYAHESNYTSYSHYNMALAHPLGANFREVLSSVNYRPTAKLYLQVDLLMAKYGNDLGGFSYGRDILKSYLPASRPPEHDYGNDMFQGETVDLTMLQAKISYMIMHNMTLSTDVILRKETSSSRDQFAEIFSFGFRWNFPYRSYLF